MTYSTDSIAALTEVSAAILGGVAAENVAITCAVPAPSFAQTNTPNGHGVRLMDLLAPMMTADSDANAPWIRNNSEEMGFASLYPSYAGLRHREMKNRAMGAVFHRDEMHAGGFDRGWKPLPRRTLYFMVTTGHLGAITG